MGLLRQAGCLAFAQVPPPRSRRRPPTPRLQRAQRLAAHAVDNPNLFVELIGSTVCGAAAVAVTVVTAENKDAEIERIQVRGRPGL